MSSVAPQSERGAHSLRDLPLRSGYRTGAADLVADFYVPCLARSVRYDRTAGYFDVRAFAQAADGIGALIDNGGRVRLIVSPRLRRRDAAALTGRYDPPRAFAEAVADGGAPAALADWLRSAPHGCTSWLVRNGHLDVRVAFLVAEAEHPFAHYHEKLGVFADRAGNRVAFSGSINETGLAWNGNFESVDVFRSWRHDERHRVVEKAAAFDDLWTDETPGVVVKPIEAAGDDGIGVAHLWSSLKTALARRG